MTFKNNKFYKMAQAIDSFSLFMPTGDVKKDLIEPVLEGTHTFDEIATEVAEYIWECMNYDTNPQWIRENGLSGKKKYYPEGNWHNNKLYIDIEGEDAGLKDYIKSRLMNFEAMLYEYYLMESIESLGLFEQVKEADGTMDKIYKVDVLAKDLEGEAFNISVFKSTDKTALYKLNNSKKAKTIENRLAYNVNKLGDPRNPDNVMKWFDEMVYDNKHLIYLDNSNKFKIS